MINVLKFLVSLGLPIAVGYIERLMIMPAVSGWYLGLQKPDFHPPFWIFGPVWGVLYPLMGLAFFLIWTTPAGPKRRCAVKIFLLQLLINAMWSPVFFLLESPLFAFLLIIVLFVAIAETIYRFYLVRPWAAYLLAPYLVWVSFAGAINGMVWWLNR